MDNTTTADQNIILKDSPAKAKFDTNFLRYFPEIQDTGEFITHLTQKFNLEVDESPAEKKTQKINAYKKVKINGSNDEFYFIEYDYSVGSMSTFPWKYQVILTKTGRLLKILNGFRYDFIKIFPDENPLLLVTVVTAKGNGGHELYKLLKDSLENIYEGYYNYDIQTYDKHQDLQVYKPNELNLNWNDLNKDGYPDLIFTGKNVYIQGKTKDGTWYDTEINEGKRTTYSIDNPFKEIPIEYIFYYDERSGHFKAKENYKNKFTL